MKVHLRTVNKKIVCLLVYKTPSSTWFHVLNILPMFGVNDEGMGLPEGSKFTSFPLRSKGIENTSIWQAHYSVFLFLFFQPLSNLHVLLFVESGFPSWLRDLCLILINVMKLWSLKRILFALAEVGRAEQNAGASIVSYHTIQIAMLVKQLKWILQGGGLINIVNKLIFYW